MASVVSVNISEKKGTFKKPIEEGRLKKDFGIEGDAHGGKWHRQISLLGHESIEKMIAQGAGDLKPGMFAENVTTEGIELYTLPVGTRLMLGDCLVEVTQIGKECHQHCEIYKKVGSCVMPLEGIFVRVLEEGTIRPGDRVEIVGSAA
ncbi:MOSC domain-containing protein [Christensenellaceae bacterium OttesenSCG-928-M15]|nr:MOSC domain-containing protein [Christensenellaceae bacterium OttesenSCG-928-M15]